MYSQPVQCFGSHKVRKILREPFGSHILVFSCESIEDIHLLPSPCPPRRLSEKGCYRG